MNPSPILLLHIPKLVLDSMCSNENQNSDVIDVPLELVTPQGFFPKTRNPPFEWLFTVAMDSWSLQSILVMDSTLSPVLHSCLKQSVTIIVYFWRRCEQRAMIMGCRFILDKKIGMEQPPRELRMQTSLVLIQLLTLTKLKIYGALCACGCNVKSSWHWRSWKDQNEKQSGPNHRTWNQLLCKLSTHL